MRVAEVKKAAPLRAALEPITESQSIQIGCFLSKRAGAAQVKLDVEEGAATVQRTNIPQKKSKAFRVCSSTLHVVFCAAAQGTNGLSWLETMCFAQLTVFASCHSAFTTVESK